MKRMTKLAAVAALSGTLLVGTVSMAAPASAANGGRSGAAEGVITIIKSAVNIVGLLNGPSVNTDVTIKNTTGFPIEIVAVSPPYAMQVTAPILGTRVNPGEAFQLGMSVERDTGGQVNRDAGVSVVVRPIVGMRGSGLTSAYSKNIPIYGADQGITVKAIGYDDNRLDIGVGYGMVVKVDGRAVTAVAMTGRNVMPSLGVVSLA